jgi:hypothetical protein
MHISRPDTTFPLTEKTFVAHAFTYEPISCYLYAPHPTITSSILFRYAVFAATFFVI